MRDYEDEILDYEIDAESRYDDFNGDYDEDYFDTGFEGNEDFQEMEYIDVSRMRSGMYDNYTTTSIGKIDPNDRTLTVVVANALGAAAQAILFGGNEEAAQPAGVEAIGSS